MNSWTVRLARSAEKELERLPASAVKRIRGAIHALADNPYPRGSKKMVGKEDTFRIRVGEYRVVYEVHKAEIAVLVCGAP